MPWVPPFLTSSPFDRADNDPLLRTSKSFHLPSNSRWQRLSLLYPFYR